MNMNRIEEQQWFRDGKQSVDEEDRQSRMVMVMGLGMGMVGIGSLGLEMVVVMEI